MNINRDGTVLKTHRVKPLKNSEIGNQQGQADQSSTIYESPSYFKKKKRISFFNGFPTLNPANQLLIFVLLIINISYILSINMQNIN